MARTAPGRPEPRGGSKLLRILRARHRAAVRAVDGVHRGSRGKRFKVLFAAYEARCKAAGVKPKSKRAVGMALAARFPKTKADGGEVHYAAQPRKGLTVVAA